MKKTGNLKKNYLKKNYQLKISKTTFSKTHLKDLKIKKLLSIVNNRATEGKKNFCAWSIEKVKTEVLLYTILKHVMY